MGHRRTVGLSDHVALPAIASHSARRYSSHSSGGLPPRGSHLFLTVNLRAIAAVCVQLKAAVEKWALYMVFSCLTPAAVRR